MVRDRAAQARSRRSTADAVWKTDTLEGLGKGSRVWTQAGERDWALGTLKSRAGQRCTVVLDNASHWGAAQVLHLPTRFVSREAWLASPTACMMILTHLHNCKRPAFSRPMYADDQHGGSQQQQHLHSVQCVSFKYPKKSSSIIFLRNSSDVCSIDL